MSPKESAAISAELKRRLPAVRAGISNGLIRSADGSPTRLQTFSLVGDGSGWIISNDEKVSLVAYPSLHGLALSWKVSVPAQSAGEFRGYLDKFVAGLSPRALFTVPSERGVCFPHMFVRDGGDDSASRVVAATYRLIQHPDVTIMLEDSSALQSNGSHSNAAIKESNRFWTQNYPTLKSRKNLHNGSYRKIDFVRQEGIETKFQIVRADDTEDFGYLVVVRGEPNAETDIPYVKLHLVRNARNASLRGVAPLGEKEFFALAEAIAASVQHRDVK